MNWINTDNRRTMDTNKMITADTARKIWSCYKEMEHCQELMAAAHERLKQETEGQTSRDEPEKKFHPIEMGIPYFQRDRSDTSHRIYQLTTAGRYRAGGALEEAGGEVAQADADGAAGVERDGGGTGHVFLREEVRGHSAKSR